ncbi:MAG: polysaccharide deacetylase family protein [Chitinophagales bacterium]|nr:polysaccharide deacetylase family protein [Chitinophagales bacterium]
MYLPKTPKIAKKIFPKLTWQQDKEENTIYLSFDDGPTPGVTEWVLDCLRKYDAKASFFCLGKNVVLHPEIFERIIYEGHSIGNHTYNHLNSWNTRNEDYLYDIECCQRVFHSTLFRPPYGKLKPGLRTKILKSYKIVMWDVMSYDFDEKLSANQCIANVLDNVQKGSIVVFHDSIKAFPRLKEVLPKVLDALSKRSYQLKAL